MWAQPRNIQLLFNNIAIEENYLERFAQKIIDYLTMELLYSTGQTLCFTTDILESLFGKKYKQFSSRSPLKQIGQIFLSICLSTMNLTTTTVKKPLETVRFWMLKTGAAQVFSQSMSPKRRILFSASTSDTETA